MTKQGFGVCHQVRETTLHLELEEKETVNQSIDMQGMCLGPRDDNTSTNKLF